MLEALLQEERVAVEALAQQLRCEYAVLKTHDAPALEQIVREKLGCAERLQALVGARSDYLRNQGFAADRQGLAACIAAAAPETQTVLAVLATDLENAVEQARRQNEVNGAVIAAGRSYVERALAILSGRDSLDFLYDQGVRRVFGGGSPLLAKV